MHHFATLFGYGASAVNPYLAQDCIGELVAEGALNKDYYAAVDAYDQAILDGVMRIASKMGISSMQSYEGAQILRPSASAGMSWTGISQTRSAASAASACRR